MYLKCRVLYDLFSYGIAFAVLQAHDVKMSVSAELLFLSLLFVLAVLKILAVGAEQFVPPDERRRVIANEVVVVEVVKPHTSITRYKMKRVEERHIIAAVHVNGFHQPDCDPCPQQYEMSCGRDDAKEKSKPKYCKQIMTNAVISAMCLYVADYITYERTSSVSSILHQSLLSCLSILLKD